MVKGEKARKRKPAPFSLRHGFFVAEVEDGSAILNEHNGKYYLLNSTGSFILNELQTGRTPEAISAAISNRFGTSPDAATEDVQTFLDHLIRLSVMNP